MPASSAPSADGLRQALTPIGPPLERPPALGPCAHLVYAAGVGSGKYGFPFWNLDPAALGPREAWRRFKSRSSNGRHLTVLRELAAMDGFPVLDTEIMNRVAFAEAGTMAKFEARLLIALTIS